MHNVNLAALLALLLLGATLPSSASANCTDKWFHGTWRSDADKSIENFAFQGIVVDGATKERYRNEIFGKWPQVIDSQRFAVIFQMPDGKKKQVEDRLYRVVSCTSSTVTLRFPKSDWPDTTLYKTQGCYLLRSGKNFEYFCQQAK